VHSNVPMRTHAANLGKSRVVATEAMHIALRCGDISARLKSDDAN
jgi:hypothetical protein